MTQSTQTSVDRTVSDMTPNQRHAIEELVGGDLAPDQRIFVLAYRPGIEPNEAEKAVARNRMDPAFDFCGCVDRCKHYLPSLDCCILSY